MSARWLVVAVILALPAGAMELGDAKPPTQAQLTELLRGNTIVGEWDGRPFTQYFAPGGATRYREGDGPASDGSWRVNSAGQYCSIWPPSPAEACYEVRVKGAAILWLGGDKVHPSEVVPGNAF